MLSWSSGTSWRCRRRSKAIKRYADEELQPGDLVCLLRTSGGSGAWQQFTSDRLLLRKAIDRMRWRPPHPFAGELPVIAAVSQTVRDLGSFPGRKCIVLVGPGAYWYPELWNGIRRIGDAANRASVTIDTIDAQGLPTLMPSADGRFAVSGLTAQAVGELRWPYPVPAEAPVVNRMLAYKSSQDAFSVLADMTGGLFQHENNDLFGQLKTAIDDSDGYYLIGWYPGSGAFNLIEPLYHRIQIRVSGKDLIVRSRKGYFAVPGTASPPVFYTARAADAGRALFTLPERRHRRRANGILGYDKQTGPYFESLLRVWNISFHDVPTRPGCKTANLELLATPMPLDWRPDTKGRTDGVHSTMQLCGKALEGVLADGFIVVDRQQVKQPGMYQMRVSLRNILPGC